VNYLPTNARSGGLRSDEQRSPLRVPQHGKVIVVDDDPADVPEISALLSLDGHSVIFVPDGPAVTALGVLERPDVIVLDVSLPGSRGFELCQRLKHNPSTCMIPVVLVTDAQEAEGRIRGLEAGADDFFIRPINAHELRARVRSLVRLKRLIDDLESAQSIFRSLALTIEARDPTTAGHCQRLSKYATALGAALHLGDDDLALLRDGGFLHDIGKVAVPDAILLKPSRLTPFEQARMRQHTIIGDSLCGEVQSLAALRSIVRSHHERLDGSGYPDGLEGDRIPLLAQIVGLVDCFDALTTKRPYKPALSRESAYDELRKERRRGWRRRDLTDEFIALERSGQLKTHYGAFSELSAGRSAAGGSRASDQEAS
jgi:putative two-component system response regulator